MSRKIVNTLKSQVKELKYADLGAKGLSSSGWYDIYSGNVTYKDLNRCSDITINGQKVTNEFIRELYSKHESLLIRDENEGNNDCTFLKAVFTEMFEHAGAIVPNDLIIEELITNYNQAGYPGFFRLYYNEALLPCDLLASCSERISIHMECNDPNHLRCFSNKVDIGLLLFSEAIQLPYNLCSSVEFEMKYKNGNVTYEGGKVLLTIPKELEDYKAGDDSLLDKLTDIINKLVEYFKKLCEKLDLKFDTRIEYDSERNIKIEHKLGKPLQVIDESDVYAVNGLKRKAQ